MFYVFLCKFVKYYYVVYSVYKYAFEYFDVGKACALAYVLFIISLLVQYFIGLYFALAMVAFGLLFQLVTLPVEIDASRRALKLIEEYGIVNSQEHDGTKKVLVAAAMTYVAAVLSEVLNLLRILLEISNNSRRR